MPTNTVTNHYGSIAAEIYDLDKPIGGENMPDAAFHLARFAGFAGSILEPACGSGRVLIPLLEAGCDVTGFDPSGEMLDRCRARCAERGYSPALSQQRFEDFRYDRTFDAILVPAGSFTLVDTFEQGLAVLARFRDHLAPGGIVVIDIDPLRTLGATGGGRRHWTADNGDLLTLESAWTKTDWLGQRKEAATRYERWREGALIESQLMPWAQRFWGLEEFRFALRSVGFGAITVTGGYERGQAVKPGDPTWTFEVTREG